MPARRSARLGPLALAAVLAGSLITGGPATADPVPPSPGSQPTYPSQQQVDAARAHATRTASSVGALQSQLTLADQRLQAASVRAEEASEAYNGAQWRLQQARTAYAAARADAARARRTLTGQRDRMGALVAQSYQQGGQISALDAVMGADGPQGVLDQYAAFQGASSSLQADYQRFGATEALSRVFEARAERTKVASVRLAAQARQAQRTAVAAAQAAQSAETAIAAEKVRLVAELARAQHVSVTLARSRQSALEAIARRRAEERERRQALAAARARAAARAAADQAAAAGSTDGSTPSQPGATAGTPAAGPASGSSGGPASDATGGSAGSTSDSTGTGTDTEPAPAPAPDPAPLPAPVVAPVVAPAPASSSKAAARAIAFAEAQLGDPYQWGAAGPGSWDCSGLMMGAWGAAGVALPHYSVAQYEAGTPISVTDLRPGDLVFWSSNGRPSGIHHVAMYIGGGQIIHAPRTGRPVEIDDMYYWIPPTFFARV